MTFTVRDWLTRSFRLAGILAEGETLQQPAIDVGLTVASELFDEWRTQRLTIFVQGRHVLPLLANQQDYTIGAGGNWNFERPLWFDQASWLDSHGLEQRIRLYTDDEWEAIPIKGTQSTLPFGVYVNENYPLATGSVYPVPIDPTVSVVLYSPDSSILSVTDINASLSVPPGWAKALRYNLTVDLCNEYQLPIPEGVEATATRTLGNIKRTNDPKNQMRLEAALLRMDGRRGITHAEFLAGE